METSKWNNNFVISKLMLIALVLVVTSCIVDSRGMSAAAGGIHHQHKVKLIVVSTGPGQAVQRCRARRDAMVGTGQI